MEDVPIIKIEHVSKVFDGKEVLKDVSLDIKRGEFVTILGPSGCGKTTLLRMIAGFEKPTQGQILLNGRDVTDLPPYKRPLNTVFQRYALFPHLNVYENVAFSLQIKHVKVSEMDKRVMEALKLVGMEHYSERDVTKLSGGQQQRVAIARACVANPKLILADEPTGNLDSKNGKEVMDLLKELNQEGTTIVMVTHSQKDASQAQRTIDLFDGQIVSDVKNEL